MAIPVPKGDKAAEEFRNYLERGLEGENEHEGDHVKFRQPSGSIAVFWLLIGFILTSMLFLALFTVGLWFQSAWLANPAYGGPTAPTQQMLSFWMGMFFLDLAIIFDLYRKHFVEDAMIVRRRRPKYIPGEDPTKNWDSQWNTPKANRVDWYSRRQKIRPRMSKEPGEGK